MFLVSKFPKKLRQQRYLNIEHGDSSSFVIGILAVFLEKLGYTPEDITGGKLSGISKQSKNYKKLA